MAAEMTPETTPVQFDLSGRVALVIGGTSGIGRAIALGLADAGADVVASSRRQADVEAVAHEIRGRGRRSRAQGGRGAGGRCLARQRRAAGGHR